MKIDGPALRRLLLFVSVAGLGLGLAAEFLGLPNLAQWSWRIGAAPVLFSIAISIFRDLRAGRMGVDATALISLAAALALGQSLAGAIVAVMYAGGNLLEDFAVGRAQRDLKALIDRAPRLAHRKNGEAVEDLPVDAVAVGDEILVRAGEVVPIDGLVVVGATALIDEAALTGEPIPVIRREGEKISSGAINAGEAFVMRASAAAGESAYAGIVRMATAAQAAKAPFMRMADRYALLLLPVTLIIAGAAWLLSGDPIRALAVAVAATPCPLILAAPAAFIGGTSQAARRGILLKGGGPLEALARIRTVMFDKTGTLTIGGARLVSVETAPGTSPDEALRLAASLEQASHHVVAAAIVDAARSRGLSLAIPQNVREALGTGLEGLIEGRKIAVGSLRLVNGERPLEEWARRAARRASWRSALTVFVAVEGRVIGVLLFADELRRETPRTIRALRGVGVARIVMVTGDRAQPAEAIAAALDFDAVLAERVPSDKLDAVATERRSAPTLMVGDGVNDAPALAAADVGMAMGARGASASSEAADAVILVDRLDRVPEAIAIARRTRAIALQSIVVGMTLSGATMIAAAFGYVSPVAGALIQEAIDVSVILNALRALTPSGAFDRPPMAQAASEILRKEHEHVEGTLEQLRQIADALGSAALPEAVELIRQASAIVGTVIVSHEREDEEVIYPRVSGFLRDSHGLRAMSRAHREILHQARLLAQLSEGLDRNNIESYLVRDAQHMIETIEALVRIHNSQEEDIYEHAAAPLDDETLKSDSGIAQGTRPARAGSAVDFEQALLAQSKRWRLSPLALASLAVLLASGGAAYWGYSYFWRGSESFWSKPPAAPIMAEALIEPEAGQEIVAKIAGVIQSLDCDVGAHIEAGQLCAAIDPRPYQLLAEQAGAGLAGAQAQLARARSAAALAGRKLSRRAGSAAAKQAFEGERELEARYQSQVQLAEAALRSAQDGVDATMVRSPVAGVVIARYAEIGKRVTAQSPEPLFVVVPSLEVVKISAHMDKRAAQEFTIGESVSFLPDLAPGRSFKGMVTQVSLRSGGFYSVEITAPNIDRVLSPGRSTRIQLWRNPART